jgi:hypothetical protein
MSFDGPRSFAVMTDDERAAMAGQLGLGLRAFLAVLAFRHRRVMRSVFGDLAESRLEALAG